MEADISRRGFRRASFGNLISDLIDVTRDYADDWSDRFDDFEYDLRDAADDVIDERDYYHDRPVRRRYSAGGRYVNGGPVRDRGAEMTEVLEKAGLKELAAKVEELSSKIAGLQKARAKA